MRKIVFALCLGFVGMVQAEVIKIVDHGIQKLTVSIQLKGAQANAYTASLRRNLELSGLFLVQDHASIQVTGVVGSEVASTGAGKAIRLASAVTDAKSARMAARRLADAMCEAYCGVKGFASDAIACVNRKGAANSELCLCYPDGQDVTQLTHDKKVSVGPRWRGATTLFYTGILDAGPQIYELDFARGKRLRRWSFKGLATGATISPDGRTVAAILSFHGNPELYTIDLASGRWTRLTATPHVSEGQPSWSPDGRQIVYVSDETRHPQLYVIDVATCKRRRLTSRGSQNIDPDWGKDGRITYITKRGGTSQVAVLDPARGESSVELVTGGGSWEHPSWSRDGRHLVACCDGALWIVDTLDREKGGSRPEKVFSAVGNWITPAWRK